MVAFWLLVAGWALALVGVSRAVWRTGRAQLARHGRLPDLFPFGMGLLAIAFIYSGGVLYGVWVNWLK